MVEEVSLGPYKSGREVSRRQTQGDIHRVALEWKCALRIRSTGTAAVHLWPPAGQRAEARRPEQEEAVAAQVQTCRGLEIYLGYTVETRRQSWRLKNRQR